MIVNVDEPGNIIYVAGDVTGYVENADSYMTINYKLQFDSVCIDAAPENNQAPAAEATESANCG